VTRIHLSGVVVCQDNEDTIGAVIDSLRPGCDEIVVVDGGSTDSTREIARSRPKVRLVERAFDSHAAQKNYGCDQAAGRWVLILDTDELIDRPGMQWLRAITHVPGPRWYSLPRYWLVERDGRLHYLAGKPYYRDRQLRLSRNDPEFRYQVASHPVHHEFRCKAGFGRPLRHPHIFHYAFLLQSREERERKFRRYMEMEPESERLHRQQLWEDQDVALLPLPRPAPAIRDTQHGRSTPAPTSA
jgi:glycosyltransferase involved in cell wall biosynthesis